jgi:hypothetical protein
LSKTVLCVQTTLSIRFSAPRPAMAYRSQSLDCHNSPIVLGVCSEMFYLRRTAQRNEVTTGGRSSFSFLYLQDGVSKWISISHGAARGDEIHVYPSSHTTYTQNPPTPFIKNQSVSKLNPRGG